MHRYSACELFELFSDKTLATEIIPYIKNNKIEASQWDLRYKTRWKDIQSKIQHGLLCPICGTFLFKFYSKHLEQKHNMILQQWYDSYHCIKIHPKCPICQKETKFIAEKLLYRQFCCNAHAQQKIDLAIGISAGWTTQDIINHNEKIFKASALGGKNSAQKYGSEFSTQLTETQKINRGILTEQDYQQWQKKQFEKKRKAGILGGNAFIKKYPYETHLKSFGFRTKITLPDNRVFSFLSQQELFHFLKILYLEKYDYDQLSNNVFLPNSTTEFNGRSAYTDLLVFDQISGLINYEVHYEKDHDRLQQKKYCSELNGIKFQFENIDDYTYPDGKYIQELKNENIDLDRLYTDLETINHSGHSLKLQFTDLSSYSII